MASVAPRPPDRREDDKVETLLQGLAEEEAVERRDTEEETGELNAAILLGIAGLAHNAAVDGFLFRPISEVPGVEACASVTLPPKCRGMAGLAGWFSLGLSDSPDLPSTCQVWGNLSVMVSRPWGVLSADVLGALLLSKL